MYEIQKSNTNVFHKTKLLIKNSYHNFDFL